MSSETVTISREEYEEYELLKSQNEQLARQIEFLTEQIRLARRQRFGSSSEQSRYACADAKEKFVNDFIHAWVKVMDADRFDVR